MILDLSISDNDMCVSIVITTYNNERTLPSVLNQLFHLGVDTNKLEIIIVDGGSRDNTLNIIEKFVNEHRGNFIRVKEIKHSTNLGISKARNAGIHLASCPYTLILDSDIILPNNALAYMLSYLSSERRNNNKVIGVIPLIDTAPLLYKRIVSNKVLRFTYGATAAFLVVTNIIKENLYDEELGPPHSSDEDIELGARLIRKGFEVHVLGNIIAKHLKESTSLYITVTPSIRGKIERALKIIRSYFIVYTMKGFAKFFQSLPVLYKIQYILCLVWLYELLFIFIILPLSTIHILLYMTIALFLTISLFVVMNLLLELKSIVDYKFIHMILLYVLLSLINRSLRMFSYQFYIIKEILPRILLKYILT